MSDSMNGPKSVSMNDDNTDYQSLIEPYLRQALSEQELAAFEAQLLEDEALLNEVQRAEAMGNELRADPTLLESKAAEPARATWLVGWQQWFAQPQSLAACLAIVALAGLPLLEQNNAGIDSDIALQPIATAITLQNLRNNGSEISVPGTPPLLLTIDIGLSLGRESAYELSVVDISNDSQVLHQTGLNADNDGWLRVVLNKALQGRYSISVNSSDNQYQNSYQVNFVNENQL
ncbi:MAG: hypothetical protein MRY76_00425 [Pseudomonadales bacterium]|nr:hypothetical protein [Pseudomonadales bacterium]